MSIQRLAGEQIMVRCPGQDQRFWKPQDVFEVQCSGCGRAVEFFKDEPKLKCRGCGQIVVNPKIDLGCAEWCQYAEQCIGVSTINSLKVIRDKLVYEMEKYFAGDEKHIEHALAVLNYAEQIQAVEGGDPLIVRAAAILHDIGIHEAQRKHGSSAGKYQEIEGPPIATEILGRYDLSAEVLEHISKIIANHHSAKDIDTIEFRVVWDADWLVNIPTEFPDADEAKLREIIDKRLKTGEGRRLAEELFLGIKL
ncbi:MAG: HD domain-containing protein [Phycisphaerales bacterium]|nr:MAG: HD domain-containing protein [Phycisphaerales bacterium]